MDVDDTATPRAADLDAAEARWRAEAGHPAAMYRLGHAAYRSGELRDAQRWWGAAADAGDARAMNALGTLHEDRGELDLAERMYRSAVAAGNDRAAHNLEALRAH